MRESRRPRRRSKLVSGASTRDWKTGNGAGRGALFGERNCEILFLINKIHANVLARRPSRPRVRRAAGCLNRSCKRNVRDDESGAGARLRHRAGVDLERRIAVEAASTPVAPRSAPRERRQKKAPNVLKSHDAGTKLQKRPRARRGGLPSRPDSHPLARPVKLCLAYCMRENFPTPVLLGVGCPFRRFNSFRLEEPRRSHSRGWKRFIREPRPKPLRVGTE